MHTPRERKVPWIVLAVALVLATRVLGLSLVLPALPAYARALVGTDATGGLALAGFAFGAYALAMAALQVPFGILSDRVGRRPAIVAGLAVSAVGSFAASWAPTIEWLVAARLVQGAGAVNGVALALLGEEVPPERRTMATALAGAAIGAGFTGGVILGAVLAPFVDVPGLFVLNGLVVVANLLFVLAVVRPRPPVVESAHWRDVLRGSATRPVLGLDAAQFLTNFSLHAVLFAFPLVGAAFAPERTVQFTLAGVVIVGGVLMFGGARRADKGGPVGVGRAGTLVMAAGAAGVAAAGGLWALALAGVLFFAGQSVLSALLPSSVSRVAEAHARGGAQSGLQVAGSLGVAAGSVVAGVLVDVPAALAAVLLVAGVLAFGALEWGQRGQRGH